MPFGPNNTANLAGRPPESPQYRALKNFRRTMLSGDFEDKILAMKELLSVSMKQLEAKLNEPGLSAYEAAFIAGLMGAIEEKNPTKLKLCLEIVYGCLGNNVQIFLGDHHTENVQINLTGGELSKAIKEVEAKCRSTSNS